MGSAGWWLAAGMVFLVPAVAFVVEWALIVSGHQAITPQVRAFSASHGLTAFLMALALYTLYTYAVAALIFHLFLWDKLSFLS